MSISNLLSKSAYSSAGLPMLIARGGSRDIPKDVPTLIDTLPNIDLNDFGSAFDGVAGVFTAPVRGMYQITMELHYAGAMGADFSELSLVGNPITDLNTTSVHNESQPPDADPIVVSTRQMLAGQTVQGRFLQSFDNVDLPVDDLVFTVVLLREMDF